MNTLTNGATIEVVDTGRVFHTLKDWGLAMGNTDYIGDPEMETYYVNVPGADGFLDFSESVTGRRIFKSRPINIELGGKKPRNDWDHFISGLRNLLEGKEVKVIFDNDSNYFWTGRASIREYARNREIGSFTLSIPQADPFKYNIEESTEDWLWDPFDFETGLLAENHDITLTAEKPEINYYMEESVMPFVPVIQVDEIGESGITMRTTTGETYQLVKGRNRFADIVVADKPVTLNFKGQGKLSILYRRGSL